MKTIYVPKRRNSDDKVPESVNISIMAPMPRRLPERQFASEFVDKAVEVVDAMAGTMPNSLLLMIAAELNDRLGINA